MQQPLPICPSCGQFDQARKVSAVYHAGTRWTDGLHGASFTQTHLAARFAPPPGPPRPRSCLTSCLRMLACCLTLLSAGLLLLNLAVGRPLIVLLPLIVVCGGVSAGSWGLVWLSRRWAQHRAAPRLACWAAERRAWEQRYYCPRCDDTFVATAIGAAAYTGKTVRLP